MIMKEVSTSSKEKNEFDQLTEQVNRSKNEDDIKVHTRDLQPLFDANPDCIGWICIPDTELDYPVMYTPSEPQKYLRRNFEGESSTGGVPFLQENCTIDGDHLIIYGHNMRNGSMFADVAKYDEEAFYKEHSVIEFETADGVQYYDVYAVAVIDKYDEWYGFVMDEAEEEYDKALSAVMKKALYCTNVKPIYGKKILTLSTCYGRNDDDRIVVIGVER